MAHRINLYAKYKPKYALHTFYDLRKSTNQVIQIFLACCKNVMIDSGAFSAMNGTAIGVDWERYVYDYVQFLKKYKIKTYIELDLDKIIGFENVQKIQKYLELQIGCPPIYVFHKYRGFDWWQHITKKYQYCAIGCSGLIPGEKCMADTRILKYMVGIAHKNGCKVHGLAYTRLDELNSPRIYFDSVDSTSWNGGGRFGVVYRYKDRKICKTVNKNKNIDYRALDEYNLRQWINLQEDRR